jgi:thioredoxin reductase
MMRGLAKTLPQHVALYENSGMKIIERHAAGFRVASDTGVIQADRIVIAAGVMMRHLGIAANRYPTCKCHVLIPALLACSALEIMAQPFA